MFLYWRHSFIFPSAIHLQGQEIFLILVISNRTEYFKCSKGNSIGKIVKQWTKIIETETFFSIAPCEVVFSFSKTNKILQFTFQFQSSKIIFHKSFLWNNGRNCLHRCVFICIKILTFAVFYCIIALCLKIMAEEKIALGP